MNIDSNRIFNVMKRGKNMKSKFMLLSLLALLGLAACGPAPAPSSEVPSTPSSSETSSEPSSEVPSSEEPVTPSSSEEPSSETPSSSEEPSSEIPSSSEEPSIPASENLIYFQDASWWQNGGAGVAYILTDDINVVVDETNFGEPATHEHTNDFMKCNYWSVDLADNTSQYIIFTRIGTAGGNQPVRYWGGYTVAIDLTARGENDCYTIIDSAENLTSAVSGAWKAYNPSEDPTEPPTSEPIDVYFKAPTSWGTSINAYVWSTIYSGYTLAGWPGTAMELVETGIYKISYDVTLYNNIIFNDGTNQTADLTSPTDPNMACYVYGKGWLETGTTEEPGSGPAPVESGWYVVGEGSFVNGNTWSPSGGIQMTVNENYTGVGTEYMALDVVFSSGDVWKLCSTDNEWISNGWETASGALFSGDMSLVGDGYGGNNVKVNVTGTYDIYYKVYGDGTYSCWISEAE
jgi:hypothetical protein